MENVLPKLFSNGSRLKMFGVLLARPRAGMAVGSDRIDLHAQLVPWRIGVDSQPPNVWGSSAALPVPGRRGLIEVEGGNLAEPLVTGLTGNSRSLICVRERRGAGRQR